MKYVAIIFVAVLCVGIIFWGDLYKLSSYQIVPVSTSTPDLKKETTTKQKEIITSQRVASNISIGSTSSIEKTSNRQNEPFPSNAHTILFSDDFNNAFVNLDYNTGGQYLIPHIDAVHIDSNIGINNSSSIRFDWTPDGDCSDNWQQIEHNFPLTKEIFLQYYVRYQSGFKFDWLYSGQSPCTGTAKKFFIIWPDDGEKYRFMFENENHELTAGSDWDEVIHGGFYKQNINQKMTLEEFGNGNWHRVTFHFKQSSTPTGNDGFLYGWIDGVLRWSIPNWESGSVNGYYTFKAPSTFNQGPPVSQSEWIDNLTIWK